MLDLIKDIDEIRPILKTLYAKLEKDSSEPYPVRYHGKDGTKIDLMISVNKEGFWWGKEETTTKKKILNLFGKEPPIEGSIVTEPFEFSFSTVKNNGKFSGQFGTDDNGIYLLHKGYFSGKTMAEFDIFCKEKKMIRSPVSKKYHPGYYVIGNVDHDNISIAISRFVNTFAEFKTGK